VGTALGLVMGVGLLLIARALMSTPRTKSASPGLLVRFTRLLRAAGITSVSAVGLGWLMALSGVVVWSPAPTHQSEAPYLMPPLRR
jgi:hypothetical protein